jgi:rhodanese-related sulfurtransferase
MPIGITPGELDADRTMVLVDMRPLTERVSELGFIPGSLVQPLAGLTPDAVRDFAVQLAHLSTDGPIVLSCVSGHRSGNAVRALEPLLGPTRHLEGGLLGWGAQGYPLCFPETALASPSARTNFHAAFRSAAMGEFIQCAVDNDDSLDPMNAWKQLYAATGLPLPTDQAKETPREKLRELIDRAGALLRLQGVDHVRIVRFMEPLYSATL